MVPQSIRYLLILVCVFATQLLASQDKYVETKLFTNSDHSEEEIIRFVINTKFESESQLVIASKSEITLFVNDQLLFHVTNDSIPITRLGRGVLAVTVYAGRAIPRLSLVKLVREEGSMVEPIIRSRRGFQDFVSIYVSILLVFLAIIKWYQGKDMSDLFRIDTMFSPRNKDENILRNKVISTGNVLYFLFYTLVISGLIIIITNLLYDYNYSFSGFLGQWLLWIFYVLVFIIVKYLLISFFVYLFNIPGFFIFHIINYLRISMFFAIIWTIVILFAVWFDGQIGIVYWVISSIIVSMIFRTAIIFFKLINSAKHRLFHLFSYLCGTEILPFFWLILLASYLF